MVYKLKFKEVITNSIDIFNSKEKEKAEYIESLMFFIKLNIAILSYTDLLKVIDFSTLILKNKKYLKKILKKSNLKKYYLSELMSRDIIFVPKSIRKADIKIKKKNLDLFLYYQRISKKFKNNLEILYLVIKNIETVTKCLQSFDDSDNNECSEDCNFNDVSENCSENNFLMSNSFSKLKYSGDLIKLDDINKLNENKSMKANGNFSNIRFLELNESLINEIENKTNIKVENLIVEKQIIDNDEYNFKSNEMFNREVMCLKILFGLEHFPLLLCLDHESNKIYMNYCGTSINEENIPIDWKEQTDKILNSLQENKIFNNDFWANNLLVHKNILYVIDFGFGSLIKEEFPFVNINKDMINDSIDLLELLDSAMTNSIEKRFSSYYD